MSRFRDSELIFFHALEWPGARSHNFPSGFWPFFGFGSLGFETPELVSETPGRTGISRVKPPKPPEVPWFRFGRPKQFFENGTPKCPFFGVASLGSETPSLDSETQKRPVFLGLSAKVSLSAIRNWGAHYLFSTIASLLSSKAKI